jgi:hypothetical protein
VRNSKDEAVPKKVFDKDKILPVILKPMKNLFFSIFKRGDASE